MSRGTRSASDRESGSSAAAASPNNTCSRTKAAGYRRRRSLRPSPRTRRPPPDPILPHADLYTDYRRVLDRPDIEVVDLTPHPHDRLLLIEDASAPASTFSARSRSSSISMTATAWSNWLGGKGVRLAVNQNGRWAPHFSYMRQAVQHGLIGDVTRGPSAVHWNHHWIVGTPFEDIRHPRPLRLRHPLVRHRQPLHAGQKAAARQRVRGRRPGAEGAASNAFAGHRRIRRGPGLPVFRCEHPLR